MNEMDEQHHFWNYSLEDSITFVGLLLVSLAKLLELILCWLDKLEFDLCWLVLDLEVMGLGLSSSGLKEDKEDPVEDPLACLVNPAIGLLLSLIFSLSMSRLRVEILDLLEAWNKKYFSQMKMILYLLTLLCVFMT